MTDTEKTATLRYENQELGNSNQKETKDENRKPENLIIVKKFLNAWESSPRGWHVIFLISCVIGVLIDPLFLYIPIINEDDKCLRRDESMKNIALILRSTTDFAYILNIIVRFLSASKKAKDHKLSIWKGFPWLHLLTDILAILPFPQVVVVIFFSKMAESLTSRKFLNILLLSQYVPRILRIYISAKELGRNLDSLTRRLWVKGAFNFFLYIIAGHVFGAFWYFYSIFRETAYWHHACNSQNGCDSDSSFHCQSNSISTKNLTYFNQFCPVNPPNSTVFDFGIFVKAIESGTLGTTNFPRKFSKCFWWGLRNLSSLGSNLETSSNIWENLFAVLISMLGLLLFLYLIGNLQTYLQLESTKAEKARRKLIAIEPEIKSNLSNHGLPNNKVDVIMRYIGGIIRKDKELDVNPLISLLDEVEGNKDHEQRERVAEFVIKTVNAKKLEKNTTYRWTELSKWISDNGIPDDNRKQEIMQYMRVRLHEGKDVDVVNILGVLPHSLVKFVRKHLCLDTLKKVPMVKNKYGVGCEIICNYLKPVTYSENTYIIKKGEPLDMMLFITQGIVWSFNETSMECLQKDDYFGKELLEWVLENSKSCFTSFTSFPISTKKVKAHTKVEAFALKAANLVQVLNDFEWIFSLDDEGIQNLLATRVQRWWMHRQTNKRSPREIGGVHTPSISRGLHLVFKKGGLLSQAMMENKSN
ncbi:hypothetical protein UlMin_024665 [Ulmus minor]